MRSSTLRPLSFKFWAVKQYSMTNINHIIRSNSKVNGKLKPVVYYCLYYQDLGNLTHKQVDVVNINSWYKYYQISNTLVSNSTPMTKLVACLWFFNVFLFEFGSLPGTRNVNMSYSDTFNELVVWVERHYVSTIVTIIYSENVYLIGN